MPLLNGQPWTPRASSDPHATEQLFFLKLTGEAFGTYEEYTARRALYAQRVWASNYWDDKRNLTLEEAMHQDCLGQSLASKVSTQLCEAYLSNVRPVPHWQALASFPTWLRSKNPTRLELVWLPLLVAPLC